MGGRGNQTSEGEVVTDHELCLECAEAIAKAAKISVRRAFLALDSLHGIARVVPIDATEEMIKVGKLIGIDLDDKAVATLYRGMASVGRLTNNPNECTQSAAGDLTNPPEKKP